MAVLMAVTSDLQLTLPSHRHYQADRIVEAGVVGAEQRPALRHVLFSDGPAGMAQAEEGPDDGPEDGINGVYAFHESRRSLMVFSSTSKLSSRELPVVSTGMASSALRRGAAARWVSFSSRATISDSTVS